jgi:P4 family phage/plasmid primase-like protien
VADATGDPPAVPKVSRELVGNVLQALGGMVLVPRTVPQPCWLEDDRAPDSRPYLALANGLLDVEGFLAGAAEVLVPHSPRWFSPVALPYPFDPDADCPTWRAVLARNLGDDPGKARLLQQWAGYLLLPDTGQQRFLMMAGEGANGKSVVCAVLRGLLGADNVASVGLELFGDKFHLAETLGKLANIVPEVGELDRIAEGQLKAFVAGDAMLFERKFKHPFTARPTARLVLATNNPPHFSDKSDGVWRRVDLLRFTVQIPPHERRPGLDTVEFWDRVGELPGVLNWALAGLADLRREGRFVIPAGCAADLRQLRLESNPTRRFLTEQYAPGPGVVPTAELYRAYVEWCQETGHRAASDTTFGKEVARAFPTAERKRCGPRGGRYWVYAGLGPRPEETE